MSFKVGDNVRVRTDLKEYCYYGDVFFISEMTNYIGKIYKILGFTSLGYYYFEPGSFIWSAEMLELPNATIDFKFKAIKI